LRLSNSAKRKGRNIICRSAIWSKSLWDGRGWGASKHNCLVSYLLWWRWHVSATVGHLQVTKIYIEENYTEYDRSIGAYSELSTRSRQSDYTYWAESTSPK
jgi:hypothetical protein